MLITITRDSVCAGDDCQAPHLQTFTLPDHTPIASVVLEVIRQTQLASIIGGKATWCLRSKIPLAVLAQQWPLPRYLVDLTKLTPNQLDLTPTGINFHFTYHQQQDPEEFWQSFQMNE